MVVCFERLALILLQASTARRIAANGRAVYCIVNIGPSKLEDKNGFHLETSEIMNRALLSDKLQKYQCSGSGRLLHLQVQSALSKESLGSMDCLLGQKRVPDPLAIGD